MGLRGIVNNVLGMYIGYKLLAMWIFDAPFNSGLGWAGLVLFIVSVWFFFERVGIIPKYW